MNDQWKGAAATLLLFVATSQASAEDASIDLKPVLVQGNSSATGPDTTIVAKDTATGTKTDTPVIDIPQSISVVTSKEMQQRQVTSLQEAVSYTAGVVADEFGSDDRYDYFRIRGFDSTTLGTYRDGLTARIPAWYTASRLEPYGLERVEVLKGSTSSLFGLNGPGGLVNAITKRPLDQFHAEVYTTFGNGHFETGTDFGGPIDPEGVYSYRLTAKWQNADRGTDFSKDDRFYIAPALTISPDAGTSLTLLADFSKRKSSTARDFPAGVSLDPDSFFGEPGYNRFNTIQKDIGYVFSHELMDGLTFRQTARYTHVDLDYGDVYGATADPTVPRTVFAVDGVASRFAIDNQLQYDTSWDRYASKTLFGVDYAQDNTREFISMGTAGPIDIYNPVYCGLSCISTSPYVDWHVKQKSLGIYAQEQLTIDDRWIVTLGGRYDHVNNVADYYDSGTSDHDTAHAFTKRVGLTYKATPQLAVYGNYSTSFQPLVAHTANGYAVEGGLKPQDGEQYEVGLKYKPEGFDALFTLAYFDLSQTNVPSWNSAYTVQRQIGKVRVKGVELESKIALDDRWNATLAYSHWDAKIANDSDPTHIGNRPERVPDNLASAWLSYTIPGNGILGNLTIGGGVRYVGATYGDSANTVKVGGYAVIDASVKYDFNRNLSLQVTANNLFDRKYVTTCYYSSCYYGDQRSVLGTLRYTW